MDLAHNPAGRFFIWSEWREQGVFGWANRRLLEDSLKFLVEAN